MSKMQIETIRATQWIRTCVLMVCALSPLHWALAGPASPQPIQATQPNGTTFQAFMRGDEFQGWMETADGFTILKKPSTGFFEYADQNAAGQLVPSGTAVVSASRPLNAQASAISPKGLRPLRNTALTHYQGKLLDAAFAARVQSSALTLTPVAGVKKMLTVLVNFQDARVSAGASAYWWNAIYSPTGTSVNKYFQDNSFGAVAIEPVMHTQPQSPAGVVSVSLAQTHPNCGANCSYQSEAAWVNNALAAAAPYVNFAALDTNGDGVIGADEALIYFVVAGYEASANAALEPNVWSHAWGGGGVNVAGKSVNHWALNGEMVDTFDRMGMGAIAHELGHMGGLPDLYDTSATNAGLGGFSLMGSGSWGRKAGETIGTTPVALDALSRQYLGWSTPQSPVDGSTVSLVSGLASPSSAVLLMNSAFSTREYWLVENRPPVGWDVGLQDFLGNWTGGLLIQHVDLNAGSIGLSNFNTYMQGSRQGVMAVEPSSAACSLVTPYAGSRGCASILYPLGGSVTFDGGSTPNSNYYNGVASGLGLSAISAPGVAMTATVGRVAGVSQAGVTNKSGTSAKTVGSQSAMSGALKVQANSVSSGGVNVALASNGGVATASSVLGNYFVTYVNDGERAGYASGTITSWVDGNQSVFPDWVQINFNGSKTIDQVVLFTFQDAYLSPSEPTDTMTFSLYGATGSTVQTWDGAGWVTQATITGNNLVKRSVSFPAVTTDRIRVYINSSPNGYSYITELEAWTTAPATPTPPSASVIGTATAGDTTARVQFTPGALGTGTLVNYTADCGGITATGASSPITVTGLLNGTAYTCKVKTASSVGDSPWSALSNSITPTTTPGGINVALASNGGVATASSVLGSYFVTYVNDGERPGYANATITSWVDGNQNVFPDWVQINFNGSKSIDKLVLYTLQDNLTSPVEPTDALTFSLYGATGYTVQTWDGVAWVTQATVTGNNLVKRTLTFPTVATDRVRVYVNSSPNGYSYITELEALTAGPPVPPSAPAIGTATGGDASASVTFVPGVQGTGTLTNYTADCGGITATGSASPITVTGLTNGTSYTCKVKTTTSVGTGAWSADSNSITPAAPVPVGPSAPMIGAATAGDSTASVSFTPAAQGTGTLTNYTADCIGTTATGSVSPITVTGLTNGTSYTCKVKTTTSVGTSAWSADSNSVTPAVAVGGINVALASNGGVASASSVLGSYYTTYINDNERAGYAGGKITSWVDSSQNAFPDWAQVNFNGTYTIDKVVLYTLQDNLNSPVEPTDTLTFSLYGATSYTVQTWDGTAWVTRATVTGNNLIKRTVNFAAVSTDRVRVYVNSSPNGYSYITELEAFTAGPPVPPSAPTIGAATAGDASASVAFTPGALGSGTLVNYTADCDGVTATGSSSPITVTGLTNGVSYTCTARTTSSVGTSAWSAASNAVVPAAQVGGVNVALASNGGVASASSVLGSYFVTYANDGERPGYANGTITSWVDGTPGTFPDWLQINFNGAKTIDRVVLYTLQNNLYSPVEPTDSMTFTLYGATGFTVQTWDGAAWVTQATVTGNNLVKRSVTFAATTTDRIRVYVNSSPNGYSYITEIEALTAGPAVPPSAPTIGTAIAGDASASVAFTPGAQGSGTLVNHTADCGGITATGMASPITVTGLANGTSYFCKVKTTTSAGTSAWSANSNAVTPAPVPPSAPAIGTATAGNTSASITFAPGAQGSGTLVNHTADCGGITGTAVSSPITVTGLTNGTTYTCKVKTTTSVGTSAWSAASNTVMPAAIPPAAPSIGAASASDRSAVVSFTPGAQGSGTLTNYTADCSGITANGVSSPITVTGLVNGYDYTCRVKTTTSVGTSTWSSLSNSVTPAGGGIGTTPPAPTMVTASAGDTTISVAFNGNGSGADSYFVNCGGVTANGSASPITVSGLTNGVSTTCKVKGVNSLGAGPWSANSNAVIPFDASMLPSAPTIGTATAADAAARVAFTPGALGVGTLVNHMADCGGITATGAASPFLVTGLTNGTSYTCKVRTTTTVGAGPWSAPSNAVVPVEPAVTYFHNDISGSPMLATDASGAVVWKENYRPYGERLNNQASVGTAKLGFAGKPFDAATGLSYMGARYYDPVLGRFMGVDPKGFDEDNIHSFNRFAYANNNPYKFVDPDGRHPVLAAIGFLATRAMLWLAERQAVAILAAETTAAVATGAVVPSVALEGAAAKVTATELRTAGSATFRNARAEKLLENGGNCVYCGKVANEVDHLIPLKATANEVNTGKITKDAAVTKANDTSNFVPACTSCNRGPGGKHAKELSSEPGPGKFVAPNGFHKD